MPKDAVMFLVLLPLRCCRFLFCDADEALPQVAEMVIRVGVNAIGHLGSSASLNKIQACLRVKNIIQTYSNTFKFQNIVNTYNAWLVDRILLFNGYR